MNRIGIALLFALAACSTGPRECWGDCAKAPVLIMGMRLEDGTFAEVHDSDTVDLTLPVQGGHILFVTGRLTNFEKQGIVLLGEVRNPDTGNVVARDERKMDLAIALDGGYGQPDTTSPANAANIAVCPDYLSRDMLGQEWIVDLTATDSRQMPVKVSHRVVPACRQTDSALKFGCECECLGCYALGKCAMGTTPTGCDGG